MALIEKKASAIYLGFKGGGVEWRNGDSSGVVATVEGVVTGVRFKEVKFTRKADGKLVEYRAVNVEIQDGEERYLLEDKVDSKSGRQLQLMLLNTPVGSRISIAGNYKNRDGTKSEYATGVFVNCNGASVKHKYSAQNPGNMPEWETLIVKGKERKDNTKELQFLEAEMLKHFQHAAAVEVASSAGEFHESEIPQWEESPEPSGDVPF